MRGAKMFKYLQGVSENTRNENNRYVREISVKVQIQ